MKKMIFQYILICSFILLPSIAKTASIYSPSITIHPELPLSTMDEIYVELAGDYVTTGFVADGDPRVTIAGNNIDVDFNSLSPNRIVPFVLTPFSVNANMGALSEGIYNVNASFYVDGILEHSLNDSFLVSAIPVPAAVWLFCSGLFGLIGVARRKADA